jgi:tetratricopeptide (TPR) repeat protein
MNNVALLYQAVGRHAEAVDYFEKAVELQKANLGVAHPATLNSMHNLAAAYKEAGRLSDAIQLHELTLKQRITKEGVSHQQTLLSMNSLAIAYQAAGRLDESETLLRDSLAQRQKHHAEVWTTFLTMSLLGDVLLDRQKPVEAEPMLLQAFQGLKQREATIPAMQRHQLVFALRCIVRLYEATGQPEEWAKWRQELEVTRKNQAKSKK